MMKFACWTGLLALLGCSSVALAAPETQRSFDSTQQLGIQDYGYRADKELDQPPPAVDIDEPLRDEGGWDVILRAGVTFGGGGFERATCSGACDTVGLPETGPKSDFDEQQSLQLSAEFLRNLTYNSRMGFGFTFVPSDSVKIHGGDFLHGDVDLGPEILGTAILEPVFDLSDSMAIAFRVYFGLSAWFPSSGQIDDVADQLDHECPECEVSHPPLLGGEAALGTALITKFHGTRVRFDLLGQAYVIGTEKIKTPEYATHDIEISDGLVGTRWVMSAGVEI